MLDLNCSEDEILELHRWFCKAGHSESNKTCHLQIKRRRTKQCLVTCRLSGTRKKTFKYTAYHSSVLSVSATLPSPSALRHCCRNAVQRKFEICCRKYFKTILIDPWTRAWILNSSEALPRNLPEVVLVAPAWGGHGLGLLVYWPGPDSVWVCDMKQS